MGRCRCGVGLVVVGRWFRIGGFIVFMIEFSDYAWSSRRFIGFKCTLHLSASPVLARPFPHVPSAQQNSVAQDFVFLKLVY